jgi:hypothetical protein
VVKIHTRSLNDVNHATWIVEGKIFMGNQFYEIAEMENQTAGPPSGR